jgi:hypothetical protein
VNPGHLDIVSQRLNLLRGDGLSANNARKVFCKRGHPLAGDNLILTKGGLRGCRTCNSQWQKTWRKANPEKALARDKARQDRERTWRAANPDMARAKDKAKYEKHKAYHVAYSRARRASAK